MFLALVSLAAGNARAVTIFISGIAGSNGSSAADSTGVAAPGGGGGAGEDISAVANSSDPDNEAFANGGDGGSGGNGGDSMSSAGVQPSIGGAGGDGGAGGAAIANAVGLPPPPAFPFGLSETANSVGGAGGSGGVGGSGLDANGVSGRGGDGGYAEADATLASLTSDVGIAAFAGGGAGGVSPGAASGRGGDAVANASATGFRFASSDAEAFGGDHPGGGGPAGSGLDGSRAEAHASATGNSAGGSAGATAFAIGGNASHTSLGGVDAFGSGGAAVATATASALGEASAEARAEAGSGYYNEFGVGGRGTDITMVDAVSGRSDTRLTLYQEADAGGGGVGARGGDAESSLHATNPASGALIATSVAGGSGGGQSDYVTPILTSAGGAAHALVVATSGSGAAVTATARAIGGLGGGQYFGSGGVPLNGPGGDAVAEASAIGLGAADAIADTTTYGAASMTVEARAERLTGPIAAAHSSFTQLTPVGTPSLYRTLTSETAFVDAPGFRLQDALVSHPGALGFFAAPSRAEASPYAPGSNAQTALARDRLLALGLVQVAATPGDSPELIGSLSLDLRADSVADSAHVFVSLVGGFATPDIGVDLLRVQLSKDGTIDYDHSFTTRNDALTAVSDSLIDLGELGPASSELRQIVLNLDGRLTPTRGFGGNPNVLEFSVLMFVSAPEPGLAALSCVAGLGLYLARRVARLTPP